jgi:hypothetical protein
VCRRPANNEIASLRELVDQANPSKRRKVAINPNERFASLAQVLSQTNQEPSQRVRKVRNLSQKVIVGITTGRTVITVRHDMSLRG